MTELPQARLVGRRSLISLPVAFVIVWVGYIILTGTRGGDALEPFHNDVFWPAGTYLTSAQPGLALPIFGHLMITVVGGAFLLLALAAVFRLIRRPQIAATIAPFVFGALFLSSFLFLRAIPGQVTVVDRDARELRVRWFSPSLLPDGSRVIAGGELRALGAKVEKYGSRREADDVVRIYAWVGANERVFLGSRECPGARSECLDAADAAIAELAAALGREVSKSESNADHTVRAFVLR